MSNASTILIEGLLNIDYNQIFKKMSELQKTIDQSPIKIKLDIDKNIQSQMSGIQKQMESYQKTANGLLVPKSVSTEPIKQTTEAYRQQAEAIKQVTNIYNNYNTSTSNVSNVTQSYASSISNVSSITSSYTSNINQANTAINSYLRNINNAGRGNYNYANSIARIVSQYVSLYAAIRYLRNGFSTLKEMDQQLVELSKVTEVTRNDFHDLGLEALGVASKYGIAAENLLSAQVAFGRAGYENVKQMGELAVVAMSAGQLTEDLASSFMVAADKSYKFDGSIDKLRGHIDSLNQVSNRNAVDFEFLAEATTKASNVMTLAGETAQQQVAIWTTMGTVTQRSGSEVGRATRNIELRLQQVKQAFEGLDVEIDGEIVNAEELSNAAKALKEVGIEVLRVENGVEKFSTLSEVAFELRQALDEGRLSATEMNKIVDALAGKWNSEFLLSLINNMDLYSKAMDDFTNASGSAISEAMKQAEGWEGKLNSLSNEFAAFLSKTADAELVKRLLDALTFLVKGFDNLNTVIAIAGAAFIALRLPQIIL